MSNFKGLESLPGLECSLNFSHLNYVFVKPIIISTAKNILKAIVDFLKFKNKELIKLISASYLYINLYILTNIVILYFHKI